MAAIIQTQEQSELRLQRISSDQEKQINYLKKQNLILKNQVLKKEKQIEQQQTEYKDKMARYPVQTSHLLEQNKMLRSELEKKSADLSDLHQVVRKKEKIIEQLEQKIADSTSEFQDQHEKFLLEKNELLQKSQVLKHQLNMVSDKVMSQTQLTNSDISPILKELHFQQKNKNIKKNNESTSYCESLQKKKMTRVKIDELEQIIKQIRFTIMIKDDNPSELIDTVFKEFDQLITIEKLFEILKEQPFNISPEKACLQLARYLVEDDEEVIEFDKNKSDEKNRIILVFKKLLGPCKQMEIANEYTCIKNICQICKQYKMKLPGTINSISQRQQIQTHYFTIESLKASFSFLEVNLSEEEFHYIEFQLFKQYSALALFEIDQFLPAFQLDKLLQQNALLEEYHQLEEEKQKKLQGQQSPSIQSPELNRFDEVKDQLKLKEEQQEQYNFITSQQFSEDDFEESRKSQKEAVDIEK